MASLCVAQHECERCADTTCTNHGAARSVGCVMLLQVNSDRDWTEATEYELTLLLAANNRKRVVV